MRIGIDLGGTKIEGIVLDDSGKERARVRVATPQGSYEATVDGVAAVVRELEAKVGARCRVGVGHPGAISPATGLIKNANSTQLNGHPLDRDLKRLLERDEVRLSNDANCFAVSEAADGAGRGWPVVFGVILGTGVGGGIVIEGKPLVGAPGDRRRMGAQRPAAAARRRAARPAVLLRPLRLRRGLAERACLPASVPRQDGTQAARHRDRRGGHGGRSRSGREPGDLLRPAGAGAGQRRQPDRPARHRAGRRAVEDGRALSAACPSCGATTSSPSPTVSRRSCSHRCTAIRAACVVLRGCGRLRQGPSLRAG